MNRSRTCFTATLCLSAASTFAQVATTLTSAGGSFNVHAGSYTGSAATLGGRADFFANGTVGNYAWQDAWAYRIQGDTREYAVRSNGATFGGSPNVFTAQMFKGQNGSDANPMIRIDVRYTLGASSPTTPLLFRCVQVTNLTSSNLDFSLFHYEDYDIPGAANDNITLSTYNGVSDLSQLRDTVATSNYAETWMNTTGGSLSIQHGPIYTSAFFNNPGINNMNNVVSGGSGDYAMGWQFDGTLAPGQTSLCPGNCTGLNGSAVPEPISMVAMAPGLGIALLAKRKSRKAK